MIKNNKKKLIITSLIILLPVLFGLAVWNKLPDEIPSHWNAAGEIDDYASKAFMVLGIPPLMLAFHWLAVIVTSLDPKNKGQSDKVFSLVIWIIPSVTLILCGACYSVALGINVNVGVIIPAFIGAVLAVTGNYLPKCKQNYTIGIKVVWALEDEANWNATHRLAGKMWTAGGLLATVCAFLPAPVNLIGFMTVVFAIAVIPIIYSYLYYKKHSADGKEEK